MTSSTAAVLVSLIWVASPLGAQDTASTHRAAAVELLAATGAHEMMDQMLDAVLQSMHTQTPAFDSLPGFDSLMASLLRDALDWKVLEPEMIQMYVDVFTAAELHEMADFYRTPLGKKMLAHMPEIMQRSMAMSQERMRQAMPHIMAELQDYIQRHQNRTLGSSGGAVPRRE